MKTKSIVILVVFFLLVAGAFCYHFRPIPHTSNERIEEILKGFVTVDGGTFVMGSPDSLGYIDEVQHSVYVSTFYMQPTEVTQELYELVMETNPSENKGSKNMPVTNVSWEDCQAFIKKLNEKTGKEYRLPTEAEWEYAAKGGAKSNGYLYAGSNNIDEVGWMKDNSGEAIHIVAEKKHNELGLFDMTGNVWEWCSDWYGPYRLDAKCLDNPKGPENGQSRVLHGGSWIHDAYGCRTADRIGYKPNFKSSYFGFRLVLPTVR